MGTFTAGHSTRKLEDLVCLLKENGIEMLVDVRFSPRSRHNPQFNKDGLERACRKAGIAYLHLKRLGGFRKGGYKKYSKTPAFKREMAALQKRIKRKRSCILCAERNPYKCHRRYISDWLKRRGFSVIHILDMKRKERHLITRKRTIKCD
jgi:uncharacterized protein (DUF488 family)